MVENSKQFGLKYALDLFNAMVRDNLGYIYRGFFDDDIADSILDLTEASLQTEEQSSKIKKRVFAIMVEGLQNITRHQDASQDTEPDHISIFVIQKILDKYYITTGNIIENANIEKLENLINKINSLDKKELKQYYKDVLEEGTLSEKGGAGLGLIDMARKSGNNLSYYFKKIDKDVSYFYLHTIPSLDENKVAIKDGRTKSLDHIINIHQILNEEDVLMIFNGTFNAESHSNLTSILQKNISELEGFDSIISQMLENMALHGEKTQKELSGNPGIFYLSKNKDVLAITTGNYIKKSDSDSVMKEIEVANAQSPESIKDSDKGLARIRKETGSKILYSINEVDDNFSFLSLRVFLKEK